jgi:hypothetical protein
MTKVDVGVGPRELNVGTSTSSSTTLLGHCWPVNISYVLLPPASRLCSCFVALAFAFLAEDSPEVLGMVIGIFA